MVVIVLFVTIASILSLYMYEAFADCPLVPVTSFTYDMAQANPTFGEKMHMFELVPYPDD